VKEVNVNAMHKVEDIRGVIIPPFGEVFVDGQLEF
jgi:hypothetical protein